GPTETTVCVTLAECQPADTPPPIGRPLANTQIYILDKDNNPAPPGIPGELCIAGAGLARGYLNQPELTAEKFIEVDLFNKTRRIYKSGDLARWLPDGNLDYLGRLDNQVKLRGFRIELGEIESKLRQHENVDEVVLELFKRDSNSSLAAYVTLTASIENAPDILSGWLK
ncbi:MAG: amino acid adenylation domain-containing protein, partial [Planctomycetes bacterium]|nr:amino acid adenylation domain-containing protein [Planctomycetota bacterium]